MYADPQNRITKEQIDTILKKADFNHDRKIDYIEFRHLVRLI